MKLKKLEIAGFKSFRDRVILDFGEGISAVVGPNGCGKSNIIDSIRWVMGEQRVKALRGKKMDDVIFNGSVEASPVGMAEVTMILTSDGTGFPEAYASFSEVEISRRLFRDGESEYCINKVPCRLLDVREFFMGTGVGTRTYSLVEQNSVSTLVEAKPEDRRQFIEEAAGISKYKSRKEAAVRKMEATKQNLARLNDILREVKSQLNAISRQAKKAEQYKALRGRIRETDIRLALQQYTGLLAKRDESDALWQTLKDRELEVRQKVKACESALEEARTAALETETDISQSQEALYRIKNDIGIREQAIEFAAKKTADVAARKERDIAEADSFERRMAEVSAEISSLQGVAEEAERTVAEKRAAIAGREQRVGERKEADRAIEQQMEEKKAVHLEVATEKARLKNATAALARGIEDLQRRQERTNREIGEDRKRCEGLQGTLQAVRTELETDEAMSAQLAERREAAAAELDRAKEDGREIEGRIAETREEAAKVSSRVSSLREFHESYEWCGAGVRSLMKANREGMPDLPEGGFLGLVADYLDVPREYETAVEAVLGEKLQYVLVRSQQDGVNAIDYLHQHSLGRGSFIPLEVRNSGGGIPQLEHLREAVRLIERVGVRENYNGIAEYLLGDVLLIPDLKNGVDLWRQNGFRGTFVTPAGDIISPQGVLTGGSAANGNGDRGLLGNKREIVEMEALQKRLAGVLEQENANRQEAAKRSANWEEESVHLRSELHRLELRINTKRKDLERFEEEIKRAEQRLRVLEFDAENLRTEEAEAQKKTVEIAAELLHLEERERVVNEEMTGLKAQREALRSTLDGEEAELTKERVLIVSVEEKGASARGTIARLQESLAEMGREIENRRRDILACEREIESIRTEAEEGKKLLETLYGEFAVVESALGGKRDAYQQRQTALRELESGLREVQQELDRILKQAGETEMQFREFGFHVDSLRRNIQEKHDADLDGLKTGFVPLEEAVVQELTSTLEADRKTLENFGEVNLLALGEHEQLKERHEFLTAQIADLQESLETLQRTITRINKISRQRFSETFDAINTSFKDVFARIFPGGRGELRLTDESDLLETGVDIDIQIPGKRAQSVSLLSGGEKSLAAIALIFAILLYRPSPFLILDEVDAALDDANVSLFNGVVKDIANCSQVVLVTHNKRTMEVAQNLYGVTMQKQGISSLVSVNLN